VGGDGLFGLQLGERAAEGLLKLGCAGIVWIHTQDGAQFFERGANFLQQDGRGIVGGVKQREGGWNIGLSRPDIASEMIAQEGLRLRDLEFGTVLLKDGCPAGEIGCRAGDTTKVAWRGAGGWAFGSWQWLTQSDAPTGIGLDFLNFTAACHPG